MAKRKEAAKRRLWNVISSGAAPAHALKMRHSFAGGDARRPRASPRSIRRDIGGAGSDSPDYCAVGSANRSSRKTHSIVCAQLDTTAGASRARLGDRSATGRDQRESSSRSRGPSRRHLVGRHGPFWNRWLVLSPFTRKQTRAAHQRQRPGAKARHRNAVLSTFQPPHIGTVHAVSGI